MPGKDEWADNHFGADNSSRSVSKKWNKEDPNVRYPAHLEAYKTEVEKLKDRLKGVKNFNIFPGEKFAEATPEQIARSINRALDAPKELPFSSRVYEWVRSKFYW
jgi:hypothetical protein